MKDGTYIVIQSWMLTELKLKGNELIVYAVIFGFTQDGSHWFHGTRGFLADWCGATKATVSNCLASLVSKGYVERKEETENGMLKVSYRALKNLSYPLEKNDRGYEKNLDTPIEKICSYNKDSNKDNDRESDTPTRDEVIDYFGEEYGIREVGGIFHDYYASQGWRKSSGVPITDWRAKADEWAARDGLKRRERVGPMPETAECPNCGGESKHYHGTVYECPNCDARFKISKKS